MFTAERRQAIIDLVRTNGTMSLRELAGAVATSEVTVRRDIRTLEQQGVLDRRRGGAVWPGALSHEQSYQHKRTVSSAEKQAIGRLAATLVDEGDAIVVGAGSTTREFARQLIRVGDLTVVTNSLLVAQVLVDAKGEVMLTGGSLRKSTFAMVGAAAEHALSGVRVRRAFLSGNGLTLERGLSTPNMHCGERRSGHHGLRARRSSCWPITPSSAWTRCSRPSPPNASTTWSPTAQADQRLVARVPGSRRPVHTLRTCKTANFRPKCRSDFVKLLTETDRACSLTSTSRVVDGRIYS